MGRSIFVDDETYCKLVQRAKKLGIPIGKAVDVVDADEKEDDVRVKEVQESEEGGREFVSRRDFGLLKENFERLIKHYNDFLSETQERFEEIKGKLENIKFCPNCGHILYSHFQDHTSHEYKHYEYVDDSVYGVGGCYLLECPRCGFYVRLEKPKFWHYKDPEKQIWDLRNSEGKGEDEEAGEN